MWSKIAELGVLGFIAISITLVFGFLTVASVLDIPGLRAIDGEQFHSTVITLTAALGGAAAARFGSKSSDG